MARLVSMLLRASRGSSAASGGARSVAAGVGLVRRSCPIAAFHPQRGFAGEDASSEHVLLRRSIHDDPRRPIHKIHGVDSSSDEEDDDEFVATEKDLASDEAMWALYERWCEHFYEKRDHDEMVRRFPKFKETVLEVHEVNNSNRPYRLEINEYADMKILDLTAKCRLTEEDFARYKAQGLVDQSDLE